MAFKHISPLWRAKSVIMGHVGHTAFLQKKKKQKKKKQKQHKTKKSISPGHVDDTAFLPVQKTQITTFRALLFLAFDSTYDIKSANLSESKMYDK